MLDSLMQAYSSVQKQIRVLQAKTQSLQEFKKRQDAEEIYNQESAEKQKAAAQNFQTASLEESEARLDLPLS